MRPSSATVVQLGLHEWLMKRMPLPPTEASITTSSSTTKKNVWPDSRESARHRRSISARSMRRPRYSPTRAPGSNATAANTPRPWIAERPTR
jgi:hypothetical protein